MIEQEELVAPYLSLYRRYKVLCTAMHISENIIEN